jgi:hypothetical protein
MIYLGTLNTGIRSVLELDCGQVGKNSQVD